MTDNYDIIVIGAGHAGCEAAHAAAKMGSKVLLLTMDMGKIAQMSCNPAIGGIAKGQIVREIDALGGCTGIITDAKFKTYGCGSAIASSSLVTEWVKGKTLDEAGSIKNSQIAEELALPPVKIHCSILAEDAIKAAIEDYKKRHN